MKLDSVFKTLLLTLIFGGAPAMAQIGDLAQIKEELGRLTTLRDSLMAARVRLLAQTDSIDLHIDSLQTTDPEMADPESSEFRRARIVSRQLVLRLGFIDMAVDTLRVRTDSLDRALRDTYDWQISQLLGMLTDQFDQGLYSQLRMYQEEREELGRQALRGSNREADFEDGRLTLRDDDGPMELALKIQLAQDQVAHYQQHRHRIADRLPRLERDALLARDMWRVHEQFMALRQRNRNLMRDLTAPVLQNNMQPVTTGGDIVNRVSGSSGEEEATTPPPMRSILLQITKLRARQQELRQLEGIWQARLDEFHLRLTQILESPTP